MTKTEYAETVKKATLSKLKKMGFQKWDKPDKQGNVLMLFSKDAFDKIPSGFKVTDIFGNDEKFNPKESDDDVRFGCLSFGVKKKIK